VREVTFCDPEELLPDRPTTQGAENHTSPAGRPPGSRHLLRRNFLARNQTMAAVDSAIAAKLRS